MSAKKPKLRLGTRASALARWQADWVAARLKDRQVDVELVEISTQGDQRSGPIGGLGTQGVFTKEVQRALLDERVDLAVHSLKDLPTESVDGLALAAVPERANPFDVLATCDGSGWDALPAGARVGTGSPRRRAQLLHARADLEVVDIRGNVDTRLAKLDGGDYDALVLAAAGVERLGRDDRIAFQFPPEIMLPAIGQGALGIETRAGDDATREALRPLNDPLSEACVTAERALLARLRGGCVARASATARTNSDEQTSDKTELTARVISIDGGRRIESRHRGSASNATAIGIALADELLSLGAGDLIEQARAG